MNNLSSKVVCLKSGEKMSVLKLRIYRYYLESENEVCARINNLGSDTSEQSQEVVIKEIYLKKISGLIELLRRASFEGIKDAYLYGLKVLSWWNEYLLNDYSDEIYLLNAAFEKATFNDENFDEEAYLVLEDKTDYSSIKKVAEALEVAYKHLENGDYEEMHKQVDRVFVLTKSLKVNAQDMVRAKVDELFCLAEDNSKDTFYVLDLLRDAYELGKRFGLKEYVIKESGEIKKKLGISNFNKAFSFEKIRSYESSNSFVEDEADYYYNSDLFFEESFMRV